MSRKTIEVDLGEDADRDAGKKFLVTEMSAAQAEGWAFRALSAMARSGIKVEADGGWQTIAATGLQALMGAPYDEMRPLLDEMMACIQIVVATGPRKLVENDIEEVTTRLRLRNEVLTLHMGFSPAAVLFQAAAALDDLSKTPASTSSNTQTSGAESDLSSPRKKRRSTNSKQSMA